MEPTSSTLAYVIYTEVLDVEHRFKRVHVTGAGADAIFKNISIGWFVLLKGSWEALYLGAEQPDLVAGDRVRILISKDQAPCPTSPTTNPMTS